MKLGNNDEAGRQSGTDMESFLGREINYVNSFAMSAFLVSIDRRDSPPRLDLNL